MRVTFDTSVLVAAARSRLGASFALVSAIPSPDFQICLSVALYAEWQDVLARPEHLPPGQTAENAATVSCDSSPATPGCRTYTFFGGRFFLIRTMI